MRDVLRRRPVRIVFRPPISRFCGRVVELRTVFKSPRPYAPRGYLPCLTEFSRFSRPCPSRWRQWWLRAMLSPRFLERRSARLCRGNPAKKLQATSLAQHSQRLKCPLLAVDRATVVRMIWSKRAGARSRCWPPQRRKRQQQRPFNGLRVRVRQKGTFPRAVGPPRPGV